MEKTFIAQENAEKGPDDFCSTELASNREKIVNHLHQVAKDENAFAAEPVICAREIAWVARVARVELAPPGVRAAIDVRLEPRDAR